MEIKQMRYFLEIVRCDYNLSKAAKKLYISQPSLSQLIKSIEEKEGVLLFNRYGGRLQKLTNAGEIYYEYISKIVGEYDDMLMAVRHGYSQLKGKIKIGIPPLVQSAIFADVLANLIIVHPELDIEIIEKGAYELQNIFLSNELDIVFLLDPSNINPDIIEEHFIVENELTAFVNENHPLATKEKIDWIDLNDTLMATLDSTFMVQRKIQKKLEECNVCAKKTVVSGSWDFLIVMVNNSSFVTILPAPIASFYTHKGIVQKHFNDPISWRIIMCRPIRNKYSFVANYVYEYLKKYFDCINKD